MTIIEFLQDYIENENTSQYTNEWILTITLRRFSDIVVRRDTNIKSLSIAILADYIERVQFIIETL